MKPFKRRIYSLPAFILDIVTVAIHPKLFFDAMWGSSISATFRQRLMLAVTSVNGCRYCTYLHTREALRAGLSQDEISALLKGTFDHAPEHETKAILYAQHWADNNGKPDAQVRATIYESYGEKNTEVIEMALLLIRIGNLAGNSLDYLLFQISRGRWGNETEIV